MLGVQVLAGEPQNSYYTALAVTIYVLARNIGRPGVLGSIAASFVRLALIAVVAIAAGAVQLLPTAELASRVRDILSA